jgi:Sec-independent protein translocase protein TatA
MEIFGIGPLELLLIFLIILVVLGPGEMVRGGRKLAEWIRKVRQSDLWKTSKEITELPKQVMKETGLQDEIRQLQDVSSRTMTDAMRQTMIDTMNAENKKNALAARKKSSRTTRAARKTAPKPKPNVKRAAKSNEPGG